MQKLALLVSILLIVPALGTVKSQIKAPDAKLVFLQVEENNDSDHQGPGHKDKEDKNKQSDLVDTYSEEIKGDIGQLVLDTPGSPASNEEEHSNHEHQENPPQPPKGHDDHPDKDDELVEMFFGSVGAHRFIEEDNSSPPPPKDGDNHQPPPPPPKDNDQKGDNHQPPSKDQDYHPDKDDELVEMIFGGAGAHRFIEEDNGNPPPPKDGEHPPKNNQRGNVDEHAHDDTHN